MAQYDTEPGQAAELFYILIDANYNVVAITDNAGDLVQQYNYWPYGTLLAAEDGTGATIDFETYPEQLATNVGHQGLFWDFESWLVHNRARTYNPDLGRFMQRDPNETALLFVTALMRNGQAHRLVYTLSAGDQYGDGLNIYAYELSNPVNQLDASGQFSYGELMSNIVIKGSTLYDIYDTSMSVKRMVFLLTQAVIAGNLGKDTLIALASEGGTLAVDVLSGPAAELFGKTLRWARKAVKGKNYTKATTAALVEIGLRRDTARRLMQEGLEAGAKMPKHHMVPAQLLQKIRENDEWAEVYKAIVGKPGDKNRWQIPENLHHYLHSEKAGGWNGGWWNRVWMEAFEDMKNKRLPPNEMIEQLKAIREAALDQLGIREMMP